MLFKIALNLNMLYNVLSVVYSNAWTGYGAFKMKYSTTVLLCSDCALTLRVAEMFLCVLVCLCVCLSVLLVPGCFIIQNQRAQTQTDEWVGFPLSLSLSLFP